MQAWDSIIRVRDYVSHVRTLLLIVSLSAACSEDIVSVPEEISSIPEEIIEAKPSREACIMIVPDIQNYTHLESRFKYLSSIADHYYNNKDSIDAILQVGDLTNNNAVWQYENAYNYFFSRFTEKDQLVFCLGNHDYGNDGRSDVRMSNFPSYMMPPYDIRMEGCSWENYVRYINLGTERYGVLVLEFCTRNETLDWANNVISSNNDTPFIILLHVFLDQNGVMFDTFNPLVVNQGSSHKKYQMGDDYKNDSREIFNKIIYNNPNVKFVFCGHCLTPSYINVQSEKNVEGNYVYMLEVNYQHYIDGGSGMVAMLSFSGDSYRVRSYSTFLQEYGDIDISF